MRLREHGERQDGSGRVNENVNVDGCGVTAGRDGSGAPAPCPCPLFVPFPVDVYVYAPAPVDFPCTVQVRTLISNPTAARKNTTFGIHAACSGSIMPAAPAAPVRRNIIMYTTVMPREMPMP
jgi:hypothetical protein